LFREVIDYEITLKIKIEYNKNKKVKKKSIQTYAC